MSRDSIARKNQFYSLLGLPCFCSCRFCIHWWLLQIGCYLRPLISSLFLSWFHAQTPAGIVLHPSRSIRAEHVQCGQPLRRRIFPFSRVVGIAHFLLLRPTNRRDTGASYKSLTSLSDCLPVSGLWLTHALRTANRITAAGQLFFARAGKNCNRTGFYTLSRQTIGNTVHQRTRRPPMNSRWILRNWWMDISLTHILD